MSLDRVEKIARNMGKEMDELSQLVAELKVCEEKRKELRQAWMREVLVIFQTDNDSDGTFPRPYHFVSCQVNDEKQRTDAFMTKTVNSTRKYTNVHRLARILTVNASTLKYCLLGLPYVHERFHSDFAIKENHTIQEAIDELNNFNNFFFLS